MRARPREINIFNMSLLDILCGALGAFCFMMLVALPYYKSTGDAQQNEQDILVILQEIEQLRQRITDTGSAQALQTLIERLQAELKELQGERNQLAHQNAQLRSDNEAAAKGLAIMHDKLDQADAELDKLEKENLEQKAMLAAKKPFAVMAQTSDFQQPVDLYLERSSFIVMGVPFERFNPAEGVHRSPEPDDVNAWALERGVTFWINASTKPGSGYRVFVKHLSLGQSRPNRDSTVKLTFYGNFAERAPTPSFTLSGTRPWLFAGMLNVDEAGKLVFKEATQAEQDDAWRQITKTEPPAPASPSATSSSEPGAVDREELRRKSEQIRREVEEKYRRERDPAERERRAREAVERREREAPQSATPPASATTSPQP